MKQRWCGGNGIRWTICKSFAPRSRQITMPAPHHSLMLPNQQFQRKAQIRCENFGKIVQRKCLHVAIMSTTFVYSLRVSYLIHALTTVKLVQMSLPMVDFFKQKFIFIKSIILLKPVASMWWKTKQRMNLSKLNTNGCLMVNPACNQVITTGTHYITNSLRQASTRHQTSIFRLCNLT